MAGAKTGVRTGAVFGLVAIAVAGCAGDIEMRKVSDKEMADTKHWMPGVIVYEPALFVEISAKTTLIEGGKLKGSSADNPPACVPVQSEKTVALPDLKNPYQIRYDPGLFDSNTFGVTLQTGVLAGVNGNIGGALNGAPTGSSSGAGGGLSSLPIPTPLGIPLSAPGAPLAPGIGTPAIEQIQLHSDLPACNDGPVVLGYRRLPLP